MLNKFLTLSIAFALQLLFLILFADPSESAKIRQSKIGSRCRPGKGEIREKCVRAIDCPRNNLVNRNLDRCGFLNDEKLVCCKVKSQSRKTPKNKPKVIKRRLRRSDAACKNYKKEISRIEDSTLVHTVVYNGVKARPGEFPQMAALGYVVPEEQAPGGRIYVCGGTLISKKHILTAAHCVSNIHGLVPVEVILGVTDLVEMDKSQLQKLSIAKITKHPLHKWSFNYHDIAVLELNRKVNFTPYVKPACLMTKPISDERATSRLVVLGWGGIDIDGTLSSKLLKADKLDFVANNECAKSYLHATAKMPEGLDEGMICVRDLNVTRKADTCWGDSGGPLLGSLAPYPPLIGVTSFGQACGAGVPGVYTSVYKYLNWIEDQVWSKKN